MHNAGYGKTALMAEFIRESGIRAEWHSLSPADRDVTRLSNSENCLRRLAPVPEVKPIRRAKVRPPGHPMLSHWCQTCSNWQPGWDRNRCYWCWMTSQRR